MQFSRVLLFLLHNESISVQQSAFSLYFYCKAVTAKKELIEKIERHLNSSPNGSSTNVMTFFLSHSNNEALNRDTVRNICLDLLFAGHETTSSAACFLILYLSQHKEVLSKLQKELLEKGIFSQGKTLLSFHLLN